MTVKKISTLKPVIPFCTTTVQAISVTAKNALYNKTNPKKSNL